MKQLFLGIEQQTVLIRDLWQNSNIWGELHVQHNFSLDAFSKPGHREVEPTQSVRCCWGKEAETTSSASRLL